MINFKFFLVPVSPSKYRTVPQKKLRPPPSAYFPVLDSPITVTFDFT